MQSQGRQSSIDPVFTPEINEVLARVKVHLEFCSRPVNLTPKSLFPKSGQYRTFLSQPGSGRLIRLAKWNENTIRYWTMQTLRIVLTLPHPRDTYMIRGTQWTCSSKYLFFRANFCWLGDLEKSISLEGMLQGNRQLRVPEGIWCLE